MHLWPSEVQTGLKKKFQKLTREYDKYICIIIFIDIMFSAN